MRVATKHYPKRRPKWQPGDTRRAPNGSLLVYRPEHHRAYSGFVGNDVLVVEQHLGRPLSATEGVRHRDRDHRNDALENLEVFPCDWSHEAVLRALRALALRLGRRPYTTDLQPPAPAYATVRRYYGSWQEALRQAGLDEPAQAATASSSSSV